MTNYYQIQCWLVLPPTTFKKVRTNSVNLLRKCKWIKSMLKCYFFRLCEFFGSFKELNIHKKCTAFRFYKQNSIYKLKKVSIVSASDAGSDLGHIYFFQFSYYNEGVIKMPPYPVLRKGKLKIFCCSIGQVVFIG